MEIGGNWGQSLIINYDSGAQKKRVQQIRT
jgi:hypothetical protein